MDTAGSEDFLRSLIDSLTEHIVVINPDGIIQYVNSAWVKFGEENGASPRIDWRGADYLAVCDAAADSGESQGRDAAVGIRSVIEARDADFYYEYPCNSPEEKRWFMMRITPLGWQGPKRFVISHHNITERKLAEEKLSSLSMLDGLTGISNRRHFDFFLKNEWRRAAREGRPLSLVIFDIDFFKAYNDNYGHLQGDECLKKVGALIRGFGNRPGDLVARYGGEEFAVVLADTGSEPATAIAEKIRVGVEDLGIGHAYSDVDVNLTVSVGLSTMYPQREASETELIRTADEALYQSKRNGRNTVSVRNEENRATSR